MAVAQKCWIFLSDMSSVVVTARILLNCACDFVIIVL
jgi:hypothetical protein